MLKHRCKRDLDLCSRSFGVNAKSMFWCYVNSDNHSIVKNKPAIKLRSSSNLFIIFLFFISFFSPQGRDDADEEDRLTALLLQCLLLLLRHLGHCVRHRAARDQQRHHPAPHLHHRLLLHGAAHDTDPPAAGIHPDVVRHAGAGQEDRGGFREGDPPPPPSPPALAGFSGSNLCVFSFVSSRSSWWRKSTEFWSTTWPPLTWSWSTSLHPGTRFVCWIFTSSSEGFRWF